MAANTVLPTPTPISRIHAKRWREVYRSAGWPFLDVVEFELLAAGLLERVPANGGLESVRVTDAGIQVLAKSAKANCTAFSAHEAPPTFAKIFQPIDSRNFPPASKEKSQFRLVLETRNQ